MKSTIEQTGVVVAMARRRALRRRCASIKDKKGSYSKIRFPLAYPHVKVRSTRVGCTYLSNVLTYQALNVFPC